MSQRQLVIEDLSHASDMQIEGFSFSESKLRLSYLNLLDSTLQQPMIENINVESECITSPSEHIQTNTLRGGKSKTSMCTHFQML